MTDFTSSLYLGLDHSRESLPAWPRLTLGKPAALEEPPGSREVEADLAALVGCERVLLAPSTLHAFHDLAAMFAERRARILIEEDAYPVARMALECTGHVESFGVRSGRLLPHLLRESRATPVIFADGLTLSRGAPAPVDELAIAAGRAGGCLVIDDTQALGIFGTREASEEPYGFGGGGSLRWTQTAGDHVIVVASLAKGFGAPVAMIGGSAMMMDQVERSSRTRVHCSPASIAAITAAARALAINRYIGDSLRRRLAMRVCRLRRGLRNLGLNGIESVFPVQIVRNFPGMNPHYLSEALLKRGIRTVLARFGGASAPKICFVVTARHRPEDVDEAVEALRTIFQPAKAGWADQQERRKYQ